MPSLAQHALALKPLFCSLKNPSYQVFETVYSLHETILPKCSPRLPFSTFSDHHFKGTTFNILTLLKKSPFQGWMCSSSGRASSKP
jgi:hypothetical protein